MKLKDFHLLKKLMGMTFSDNENERRQALDQANAMLRRYGFTWERVLDRSITVVNEFEAAPDEDAEARAETARINAAFVTLSEAKLSPGFREFVDDLHEQWESRGFLTPAQKDPLLKAAQREENERR